MDGGLLVDLGEEVAVEVGEAAEGGVGHVDVGDPVAPQRSPVTGMRHLVGTSNDVECLPNDPSGNSRYVPIQCGPSSSSPAGASW